ncbi:hypothetical protein HPB48_019098 [Haemaphysalis longicornis]|uniref:Uncharacterized protein n=1 Tax=Haemaphysalis longicornis TaxID=44386 RepID=A0A9J6G7U0_HAELO|nr:hypothetical protein HPB48_019098 [Haemaphysalis longicornis]
MSQPKQVKRERGGEEESEPTASPKNANCLFFFLFPLYFLPFFFFFQHLFTKVLRADRSPDRLFDTKSVLEKVVAAQKTHACAHKATANAPKTALRLSGSPSEVQANTSRARERGPPGEEEEAAEAYSGREGEGAASKRAWPRRCRRQPRNPIGPTPPSKPCPAL